MKALLIATYFIASVNNQPVHGNISQIVDSNECRSAMMAVVEHVGLRNHVYSSSSQYMKARNGTSSNIEVSCKPIRGSK